ncbi:Rid family hydrolase [Pseudonocardia nematodicida]|uniref:Rid family hydrolase n=1 Tax=Pseudonocardia nematodicida TaxID=1206997 RepID=UPI003606B70B
MALSRYTVKRTAQWESQLGLSHAVGANGLLFVSGVTGLESDLRDIESQSRGAFLSLSESLAEAGARLAHLVELTTYHVDLRQNMEKFIEVKAAFIQHPYPAWTALGVTELISPEALVEIRAIATLS